MTGPTELPAGDARSRIWASTLRWYGMVAAVAMGVTIVFVSLMWIRGYPLDMALEMTPHGLLEEYTEKTSYDSWMPMLKAHRRAAEQGGRPYSVFFDGQGKFQYPPSMLLTVDLLPSRVVDEAIATWKGSTLQAWNSWLCRLAVAVTLLLSAAVLLVSLKQNLGGGTLPTRAAVLLLAIVAFVGSTFYPFLVGYELGQIQLVLNALIAAAILSFLHDRKLLAGALIGLGCLVKPQYGIVLLWALFRGERRLSAGLAAVVSTGVALSIGRFGIESFVDYLAVLRVLSERGEVFWYNQSLSGLLHRFVDPAGAVYFTAIGSPLPPYRWAVYAAGTITSVSILLGAMLIKRRPAASHLRSIDFCAAIVAATIASPVAWNHHYGVFFPVFAAVLPAVLRVGGDRRLIGLLAVSYLAIGYEIVWPEYMFQSRWVGVIFSHMFFGGIGLLVALIVARRPVAVPRESARRAA